MKCPNCGFENDENASHCSNCGQTLVDPNFKYPRPQLVPPKRLKKPRNLGLIIAYVLIGFPMGLCGGCFLVVGLLEPEGAAGYIAGGIIALVLSFAFLSLLIKSGKENNR